MSRPRIVQANRRAAPRIPADELLWVEAAKLTCGGSVSMIDLSLGGASFEVASRLRAGEPTELEFVAESERTVASGRIVRSEIIDVRPDSIRYRGACAFDEPLPWQGRLRSAAAGQSRSLPTASAYEHWQGCSEIQLIFRHGRRLRGYTRAFSGGDAVIEVWPSRATLPHERQVVPLALLRAIRVIYDFRGDGSSLSGEWDNARGFPRVQIAFKNGQTMNGATPEYDEERRGFWLFPESSCSTLRVFAVSSAVAEIRVS